MMIVRTRNCERSLEGGGRGEGSIGAVVAAVFVLLIGSICHGDGALAFRITEAGPQRSSPVDSPVVVDRKSRATAVFALGSFWRAEVVFGCLPGVLRTRVGYCGGERLNPDYRKIGDHAEAVEVEYDPRTIRYEQLLDAFWANHDPTQSFGQGPDVGEQYRSVIFTQDDGEAHLAALSKEREQLKLGSQIVLTQIQPLVIFYPAEAEHQKFELRRRPLLLQLLGDMSDTELMESVTAAKLNSYVADLCPKSVRKLIDSKVRPLLNNRPKALRLFGD